MTVLYDVWLCSVIPVVIYAFDRMVGELFVLFARGRVPAKRVMCEDLCEKND